MDVETKNRINKYLKLFGEISLDKPYFRIVWSDEQFEKRLGTFSEFTKESHIFIRTVQAVQEVPKYNYIQERWILEKWMPPTPDTILELPESINGSYEPYYVFQDANGNYLPLNVEFVEFIVQQIMSSTKEDINKTRINREYEERRIKEKEIDSYEELLTKENSPLFDKIHLKEAVALTGADFGIKE